MKKYNVIDLFSGCGGLSEGFHKQGNYKFLLHADWEQVVLDSLTKRLKLKWRDKDADKKVIRFDIQKTDDLLFGCPELKEKFPFGVSVLKEEGVDLVVGGPPCQAYSLAGRIRCPNGMQDDYRNFLFESYLKVVDFFKPRIVIFENVPGMLSARPGGIVISDRIREEFDKAGYKIIHDLKLAQFDCSDFGVPQERKRIIIIGVSKKYFRGSEDVILNDFYFNTMPSLKVKIKKTVKDAISDLPKFRPANKDVKKPYIPQSDFMPLNHEPRFHSLRDRQIFKILAKDDLKPNKKYATTDSLKKLYTEQTGKTSNVHKYCVQSWSKPSKTIVAHLYKDGLRHIHPDPEQCRSLTVRECARLQTFDDDFNFTGTMTDNFKMIGNAVPPVFSKVLAIAVDTILTKYSSKVSRTSNRVSPLEQLELIN